VQNNAVFERILPIDIILRNKMSERIKLDKTDRRLLRELQRNGRISNQELAERTSLSTAPCWRRLK
jgi:hypothetical protein